jgi:MoxR-like ATPase
MSMSVLDLGLEKIGTIKSEITASVLGAGDQVDLLLIAILARGHVLIEGEPGLGKSSMVSLLAKLIEADYARIQFTSDLMPSDILGYSIYNEELKSFEFIRGPIFNNVVLADEINRSSPRVQSALLEAMNEKQVTVDGKSHKLPVPFMVIATQNPLSSAGTFPLPDAELDRFLLSISLKTPSPKIQKDILKLHLSGNYNDKPEVSLNIDELHQLQENVKRIHVSDLVMQYIIDLTEAARLKNPFESSLSVRASLNLSRAAQASALLDGREHVYPDDVKKVFTASYAHRMHGQRDEAENFLIHLLEEISVP